ncbi:MAG: enoyl-CoA hydratase-related protein [Parvibaculaceae bacterium]
MAADFNHIDVQCDGEIATITLNRPNAHNALNADMVSEVCRAFDATDADDGIKAVIVTGAGEKAFSAGADLSSGAEIFEQMEASGPATGAAQQHDVSLDLGGVLTLRIFESVKPVIAAINGVAVGLGATLTLPMDCRIASTSARFGFVFCRRGIVPDGASSWFLPRLVGVPAALDLIFTGRLIDVSEAEGLGLVSEIAAPADLMEKARARARSYIESSSPVSVSMSRRLVWDMLAASHPAQAHLAESKALTSRSRSMDVVEGVNSFLEKRRAQFTDKPSEHLPGLSFRTDR